MHFEIVRLCILVLIYNWHSLYSIMHDKWLIFKICKPDLTRQPEMLCLCWNIQWKPLPHFPLGKNKGKLSSDLWDNRILEVHLSIGLTLNRKKIHVETTLNHKYFHGSKNVRNDLPISLFVLKKAKDKAKKKEVVVAISACTLSFR